MTNSLNVGVYANKLLSLADSSGLFDSVKGHESKSAPAGNGLTFDLFGAKITPTQSSGLNSLSVVLEYQCNIMMNMKAEPADSIDPITMNAAGEYMSLLAGGFTLGDTAREVDLLAGDSEGLRAVAGYVAIGGQRGDGTQLMRVMQVFVPILVNDCWTLGA